VSFAAVTICVASQRVSVVAGVYFVIDSVRELLDILSYYYGDQIKEVRWVGHVARMVEMRNEYRIFIIERDGYVPFRRPGRGWQDTIKMEV
jgi:hypothetical protein